MRNSITQSFTKGPFNSIPHLVLLALWATSPIAWGQISPSSQPSNEPVERQFAMVDIALAIKADAILASGSLPIAAIAAQTRVAEAPAPSHSIDIDQQFRPRSSRKRIGSAARLAPLRTVIEPILQQSGVPVGLAAMILLESGGNTDALSPKGARGLWQLMPDTARRYGLRVNDIEDDRVDIQKSTWAAARYLSDLHQQFGTWPLALAAYNTGEENVQRAINRGRSTEFTVLSSLGLLPLETRHYVPAVMSAIEALGQASTFEPYPLAARSTTIFAASNR